MACSLSWSWHICNGKQPFSKTRLKGENLLKCSGTFSGLVLGVRPGGLDRKVAPLISQMSFRFAIYFMFAVLGPCESLRRLRELTVWLDQDFSFHFSFVHFFLCCPHADHHLGEETCAGYRVWGVKVTSIMAEKDLERRISRLNILYLLWDEETGKEDIKKSWSQRRQFSMEDRKTWGGGSIFV
jgi:hypothetical protein